MKRFNFTFADGSGYRAEYGETLLNELKKVFCDCEECATEEGKRIYANCVDFVNTAEVEQVLFMGNMYIERTDDDAKKIKEKDRDRFVDFITSDLHFLQWHTKQDKSDTIISKQFKRKGKEYILIARFDRYGGYCYGYLVNEMGRAYVNGKGFSFDSFLHFCKDELNAREAV